jgi:hypothetical protein
MVDRFGALDERVRAVGEQLSTLAVWWSTRKGSDLAQRLQKAIQDTQYWDAWAVRDLRSNRDFRDARNDALKAWENARSLADQLQAEIRGEVPSAQRRLLLPAHPESWRGPAPTRLLQRQRPD